MADFKQNDLIATALSGIREVIDTNTVMGKPFVTENGTTIIPVTKVSVGLATGGLDYFGKNHPAGDKVDPAKLSSFGGGGGTGISVSPVGFLVVKNTGTVELLTVDAAANKPTAASIIDSVVDALERSDDIADKIKAVIAKFKKDEPKEEKAEEEEIVLKLDTDKPEA